MGRTTVYSIVLFIFMLCVKACSNKPYLPVYGDIPSGITISSLDDFSKLVQEYNITNVFLVTKDLTAVEMQVRHLSELRLVNEKNVWYSISTSLPRTVNLNDLIYIAVESDYKKYQIAFFNGNDKQEHLSAYERIKKDFRFIGTSIRSDLQIRKFMREHPYNPYQVKADSVMVVFTSGKERQFSNQDLFDRMKFNQTYWTIDADTLSIIWEDYPRNSIYDIYPLLNKISPEKPMMLVFVDGLGFNVLENAKAHEKAGFFQEFNFEPMRTVFPPKTKYAYYAVGNGLHLNESKQKKSEIFSNLKLKNVYIVEEDKIYHSSKFSVLLNTDKNNNGFIDDEIFESAMEKIDKPVDLLVVHFHSIDDIAHSYGPYAEKTVNQVELVSSFVKQLIDKWGKDFIIFSDHGLHTVGLKGTHGVNRIEDMNALILKGIK